MLLESNGLNDVMRIKVVFLKYQFRINELNTHAIGMIFSNRIIHMIKAPNEGTNKGPQCDRYAINSEECI